MTPFWSKCCDLENCICQLDHFLRYSQMPENSQKRWRPLHLSNPKQPIVYNLYKVSIFLEILVPLWSLEPRTSKKGRPVKCRCWSMEKIIQEKQRKEDKGWVTDKPDSIILSKGLKIGVNSREQWLYFFLKILNSEIIDSLIFTKESKGTV